MEQCHAYGLVQPKAILFSLQMTLHASSVTFWSRAHFSLVLHSVFKPLPLSGTVMQVRSDGEPSVHAPAYSSHSSFFSESPIVMHSSSELKGSKSFPRNSDSTWAFLQSASTLLRIAWLDFFLWATLAKECSADCDYKERSKRNSQGTIHAAIDCYNCGHNGWAAWSWWCWSENFPGKNGKTATFLVFDFFWCQWQYNLMNEESDLRRLDNNEPNMKTDTNRGSLVILLLINIGLRVTGWIPFVTSSC